VSQLSHGIPNNIYWNVTRISQSVKHITRNKNRKSDRCILWSSLHPEWDSTGFVVSPVSVWIHYISFTQNRYLYLPFL